MFLYDANGNLLTANDDSGGDTGSGGGFASYVDYTFALSGSYVIGVGAFPSTGSGGEITGDPPVDGDVYTLHVSLQGHEVAESTPDWYQFEVLAGQSTTIAATSLRGGDVRVELYDADFDIEDNNDIDSARDVVATQSAGRQWVLGAVASPDAVDGLITFDELPSQPVDGLTVEGVTFDFKIGGIDSGDATFNSGGPGGTTYLSVPVLEGAANGNLTMDFDEPVTSLSFGVALQTSAAVTPGFEVELFDADAASLGIFAVTIESLTSFSEGLFEYEGAAASRAVIDFNETAAGRFALDNVEFASPAASSGDFYRVELTDGAPLEVETFTPAHRSGEFVNELDPLVRLYDAAGNLVASSDDGASDGRNALLRYKPGHGDEGTYYIEVASAATGLAASGEYILAIKGAASPAHGPRNGDGNGDGLVDGADFLVWAAGFSEGASASASLGAASGDFNDDSTVDAIDYLVWAANYSSAQQASIQPASPLDVPSPDAFSLSPLSVVHSLAHDTALELEFASPPAADDEASIDAVLFEANTVTGATLDAWRISLAFDAVNEQDDDAPGNRA